MNKSDNIIIIYNISKSFKIYIALRLRYSKIDIPGRVVETYTLAGNTTTSHGADIAISCHSGIQHVGHRHRCVHETSADEQWTVHIAYIYAKLAITKGIHTS